MRVIFPQGKQKEFIFYVKIKSGLKWDELAKLLNVKIGTLCKSYLYESCAIPQSLLLEISRRILNEDEKEVLNKYDGKLEKEKYVIGKKIFGLQKKKFNQVNITYSNNKLDLDISNINYSKYDFKKKIKIPSEITPELAEEIGMHYGDGFLSEKRYDYRLKGNPLDEKEYYFNYIGPLFKDLYNLEPKIKQFGRAFGFEISSKALWEFKTKVLKIKAGDKEKIKIPECLKVNNIHILTSFLRGLFDTDGCLSFQTRYGYKKYYPRITLSLFSIELIKEVDNILNMLGFEPRTYFYKDYATINLNGIGAFNKYEELVGWKSHKNLNRVQDWKERWKHLNMAVVI